MGLGDDGSVSETGNWNVASDYARLKIMKQLWLADEYELISIFGTTDFIDELNLQVSPDELRIRGLKRLVNCLLMLINNTYFAVKIGNGAKVLEDFKKELKKISKIIPMQGILFRYRTNAVKKTKHLILNKEIFEKILEKVLEIKAGINKPLNQNHLIFTDKEEFDPRKFKNAMIKRMTEQG